MNEKRNFREFVPCFMTGILLGGIMGGILSFCVYFLQLGKPNWGVVDMPTLVTIRAQQVAKSYGNKTTLQQIREEGLALKEDLAKFSASRHLILFPKSTILGGNLPDLTEKFLEQSSERKKI